MLDNVSIYPGAAQLEGLQSTLSLSLSLSQKEINSPAGLEAASLTGSWRCVRGRGRLGGVAHMSGVGGSPAPGQHVLRRDTGASSGSSEVGGERTYGHTQLHKH